MTEHLSKQDKLVDEAALAQYRQNGNSWTFGEKFDPPIDLPQALILHALYIWGGNHEACDPDLPLRFHLALLKAQSRLDLSEHAAALGLDTQLSEQAIENAHQSLFQRKVEENLMALALGGYFGTARDGHAIGDDLDRGRVEIPHRYDAAVRRIYTNSTNREALRSSFADFTGITATKLQHELRDKKMRHYNAIVNGQRPQGSGHDGRAI